MQRRTKVLGAAALVLCITVGWPVAAHYRLKAKLHAYQRQLQAQGEKLTIAKLTPPITAEAAWAGNALVAAANRLRAAAPNALNSPPAMQMAVPGHAIVGWQHEPLAASDQTNVWPAWSALLASNEPSLAQARAVLQSPRLAVPLDYTQGPTLCLPHLTSFKGVALWLSADTSLALHEHRPADAWESLESLVALAQRYDNEPIMISVLVRLAIASMAANATWEAIQSPDLQEPQLRELQQAWSTMDVLTQAEATLAMERASLSELFAQGRASFANISMVFTFSGSGANSGMSDLAQLGKEVLEDPKAGLNNLARRYPGYWKWKGWQSYDDELANAQTIQAGLESLRAIRAQGAFVPALHTFEQATNAILQAHPNTGTWFPCSVARDGSTRAFLSRVASFETQRALVATALALKRYQLRHGAYPPQLSALTPDLLPQVPRDPADGQPLRYRLHADGSFLLYSVGEDGVDNGGDPNPSPSTPNSKRWLQARDVVWPAVASPAETQAYFRQLDTKRPSPRPTANK